MRVWWFEGTGEWIRGKQATHLSVGGLPRGVAVPAELVRDGHAAERLVADAAGGDLGHGVVAFAEPDRLAALVDDGDLGNVLVTRGDSAGMHDLVDLLVAVGHGGGEGRHGGDSEGVGELHFC